MSQFKPILAPNQEPDLAEVKYPIMASYKLDGIRCIFYKGQMLSRSLKPIVNRQLREKFENIRAWTEKTGNVLDGEIYSPDLTFQEITRCVMTQDFTSEKSIKKLGGIYTIPDSVKFYCFDALFGGRTDYCFRDRYKMVIEISGMVDNIIPVVHDWVFSQEDVEQMFDKALREGYEGLILRNGQSNYKFGRGTLKEGIIYKVKPFRTFDGKITDVIQGTKVNPDAEKKINELGHSVTSKKKADRIPIGMASDFVVKYQGKTLKVSLSSMTHEERKYVWNYRGKLVGTMIEYKGMLIGSKDLPRHPVFVRYRKDRD